MSNSFELESVRHYRTYREYALVITISIFLIYGLFPSESEQERFTTFFRLGVFFIFAVFIFASLPANRAALKAVPLPAGIAVLAMALANYPVYPSRVINVLITVFCASIVAAGFQSKSGRRLVTDAIGVVLVVSLFSVVGQLLYLSITGHLIEIHQAFFPWSQSRSAELAKFGIARVSGLHTEPGTHSAYAVGLLALRALYGRHLFDKIGWGAMISVLLTLSLWGFIAFFVYLLSFLFFTGVRFGKGKIWTAVILIVFGAAGGIAIVGSSDWLDGINSYFLIRADLSDGSGGAKVAAWHYGGRLLADVFLVGVPFNYDYCEGCRSPQDAGLALNMGIYFGVFFSFVLFGGYLAGILKIRDWSVFLFGTLFLGAKFFYYDPLVWLLICSAFITLFDHRSDRYAATS